MDTNRFSDPRFMGLMGLAQGLLSSSGASPREITLGEAMGNGLQSGMMGMMQGHQMRASDQDYQLRSQQNEMMRSEFDRKQASHAKLAQIMGAGGNVQEQMQALRMSGDPILMKMAKDLAPKVKSVVKGRGADGMPAFHNVMDSGDVMSTGIAPAERAMQVNQGNQISFVDPYTLQHQGSMGVGMAPGEAARLAQAQSQFAQSHGLAQQNAALNMLRAKQELDPQFAADKAARIAAARVQGAQGAQAQIDLPKVLEQGEMTVNQVEGLLNHPGFDISVGAKSPLGSVLATVAKGSDAASFDIADKQRQGAQFLQAFETLKGGGQITEVEGLKAQQAMSRMDRSNSQAEYVRAAREYQDIIRAGMNRARMKAGVAPVEYKGAQNNTGANTGGFSIRSLD